MQEYNIRTFPSEILRKKAQTVKKVTDKERSILESMARTMYLSGGVGLAAVQVGIDMQLAVIDIGDGLIKLINPCITKKDGSQKCEEGCLSVPGTVVNVRRARRVIVSFLDESGCARSLKAEGLLARAVQHELDHLRGKLIIDYLDPIRKVIARRRALTKKR